MGTVKVEDEVVINGKRDAEIIRRYAEGWTLRRLEKAYDITRERIRQIITRRGVKIRKQGRPKRSPPKSDSGRPRSN